MNNQLVKWLLTIGIYFCLIVAGFGQTKEVDTAQKSVPSPQPNNPEKKSADSSAEVFGLQRMHTIHLQITAENWEKMQPPQRGGMFFGPGAGMPPGGPNGVPSTPGAPPPGGTVVVVGGPGGPGRFGFEFEYVHGAIEIDGQTFKDTAIRFKGNASYASSQRGLKRPYKIDLDKFEKKAQFQGITKLVLNNNVMDPTKMRETLAYPLFSAAGLPAPRTGYARVYLTIPGKHEREYLGLYTLVEYVDEEFLAKHFGNGDGLLLKPEGAQGGVPYLGENWEPYKTRYDPKSGAKGQEAAKAQQRLIEFAKLVNNGSDEEFTKNIGEYLDVDAFLRYLAVNVLTSNLDSMLAMGHNYYMYLNPQTNKFVFFPWDLDLSFGGFPMGGSSEQQMDLSIDHPYTGTNKLIERLLANQAIKKNYHSHLQNLIKTTFNAEQLEKQISATEQFIAEAIKSEPPAPTGGFGRGGGRGGMFGRSIPFRDFIPQRIASVTAQLQGKSKGFEPVNRMRFGGGPGGPGGFGPPDGFPPGAMMRPGTLEAPALLKAIDANQDNAIFQTEFTTSAKQFFATADKDKNGQLNNDELNAEVENLYAKSDIMAPSFILVRSLLRLGDKNRDNQISADEWNETVAKHFTEWDTNKNNALAEPEVLEGLNKFMTLGFPRFEETPAPVNNEPPANKKP